MSEKQKKSTRINRKTFLKGMIAAPIAVSPVASLAAKKKEVLNPDNFYSYLYDATKCIGCKACVNSCIKVNTLPEAIKDAKKKKIGGAEYIEKWPNIAGERALTDVKNYFRETDVKGVSYVKEQCMHCLNPNCVSACPVSAMVKDKDTGIVSNLPELCIGCRYCMVACPYNVIRFEYDKTFPKIRKCTMCKDTYIKEGKGITACVEACPVGALSFGKRKQMIDVAKKRIADNPGKYFENRVYGEKDGGGTSVLMLAGVDFKKLDLPKLGDKATADDSEFIQAVYSYFIAPVVAYSALALITLKNHGKHAEHDDEEDV